MSVIQGVLEEEYDRLKNMERAYLNKISLLPKGSIREKTIGTRKYVYLVYREGKKVKTDYLKVSNDELENLKLKIMQRRKYEKALREIKKDFNIIRRTLKK